MWFLISMVMFIGGCMVGSSTTYESSIKEKDIVEHSCGQYNQATGEFEWLDTLTKKDWCE